MNDIYMCVHDVLLHCREHGLVVSKKKFKMGTSVFFARFVVSNKRVELDPLMVECVKSFPWPKDLLGLRSF